MMSISLQSLENQLLQEFCIMHMHIHYLYFALLKKRENGKLSVQQISLTVYIHFNTFHKVM